MVATSNSQHVGAPRRRARCSSALMPPTASSGTGWRRGRPHRFHHLFVDTDPFTSSDAPTCSSSSPSIATLAAGPQPGSCTPADGPRVGWQHDRHRFHQLPCAATRRSFAERELVVHRFLADHHRMSSDTTSAPRTTQSPARRARRRRPPSSWGRRSISAHVLRVQPGTDGASHPGIRVHTNHVRDLGVSVAQDKLYAIVNEPFEHVSTSVARRQPCDEWRADGADGIAADSRRFHAGGYLQLVSWRPSVRARGCPRRKSRRLTISLQAGFPVFDFGIGHAISSTADSNPANNSRTVPVRARIGRALQIVVDPPGSLSPTGRTDEPLEIHTRSRNGRCHAERRTGRLRSMPPLRRKPLRWWTCTIDPGSVVLPARAVAPGTPRHIRVRMVQRHHRRVLGTARVFDASNPAIEHHMSYTV